MSHNSRKVPLPVVFVTHHSQRLQRLIKNTFLSFIHFVIVEDVTSCPSSVPRYTWVGIIRQKNVFLLPLDGAAFCRICK